jgi:hypothetical protein
MALGCSGAGDTQNNVLPQLAVLELSRFVFHCVLRDLLFKTLSWNGSIDACATHMAHTGPAWTSDAFIQSPWCGLPFSPAPFQPIARSPGSPV